MPRRACLLACAALMLAVPAEAQAPTSVSAPFAVHGPDGQPTVVIEMGAATGPDRPSLVGNHGDLRGWRNLQGGSPGDPNLDLGAGSTAQPGTVAVNYDIGRELRIYDGRKRLIARFGRDGIVFYRRPRVLPKTKLRQP